MEDDFLNADQLRELKIEEIEYRVEMATNMLKEVADIIQISISWEDENGMNLYHGGNGNDFARAKMGEHFSKNVNREWGIE